MAELEPSQCLCAHDEEGQLLVREHTNGEGAVHARWTYEYDESSGLLSSVELDSDADGSADSRTVITRDDEGSELEEVDTDADGTIDVLIDSPEGRFVTVRVQRLGGDGGVEAYRFDRDGNWLAVTEYTADGRPIDHARGTPDADSLLGDCRQESELACSPPYRGCGWAGYSYFEPGSSFAPASPGLIQASAQPASVASEDQAHTEAALQAARLFERQLDAGSAVPLGAVPQANGGQLGVYDHQERRHLEEQIDPTLQCEVRLIGYNEEGLVDRFITASEPVFRRDNHFLCPTFISWDEPPARAQVFLTIGSPPAWSGTLDLHLDQPMVDFWATMEDLGLAVTRLNVDQDPQRFSYGANIWVESSDGEPTIWTIDTGIGPCDDRPDDETVRCGSYVEVRSVQTGNPAVLEEFGPH